MAWSDFLGSLWGGVKPYLSDSSNWLAGLGAAGTGLGIYDIVRRQQAEKDFLRKQKGWTEQVTNVANAPLNVEAIFNPGKQIIQRELEAGLAERGLQPGGAWAAAMGEGMMKRWLDAAQIAQGQRSGQLGALTSGNVGPVRPQFPAMGDTSAFGKYLQFARQSKDVEAARASEKSKWAELLDVLRSGRQPAGSPVAPLQQSIDLYPNMPDSGGYDEGWYER